MAMLLSGLREIGPDIMIARISTAAARHKGTTIAAKLFSAWVAKHDQRDRVRLAK
jgi:hypothetical protein